MITCGSRLLSEAERNYAVVELELLVIQWAVQKCRLYLAGADFEIITDYQPLICIMNGHNLDAIQNARIHRLMSKLLGYRLKVSWTLGKTQCIADALSSSPLFEAEETQDILLCAAFETHGGSRIEEEPVIDPALERLTKHAVNDTAYQKVHEAFKGCKTPHKLPTSHPAQALESQWDALSTDLTLPHLLLYHGCIVVPEIAKKEVIKNLHMQHTGGSKSLANARQIYLFNF